MTRRAERIEQAIARGLNVDEIRAELGATLAEIEAAHDHIEACHLEGWTREGSHGEGPPRHGTHAGYEGHRRRGEPPCRGCTAAEREHCARKRKGRAA